MLVLTSVLNSRCPFPPYENTKVIEHVLTVISIDKSNRQWKSRPFYVGLDKSYTSEGLCHPPFMKTKIYAENST